LTITVYGIGHPVAVDRDATILYVARPWVIGMRHPVDRPGVARAGRHGVDPLGVALELVVPIEAAASGEEDG
jgi:hypothetical protein